MEILKRRIKWYLLDRIFKSTGINKKENSLTSFYRIENDIKIIIDVNKAPVEKDIIYKIVEEWWRKWNLNEEEGLARKGLNWFKIKKNIKKERIYKVIREVDEIIFMENYPNCLKEFRGLEKNEERGKWLSFKKEENILNKITVINSITRQNMAKRMNLVMEKMMNENFIYLEKEHRIFGKHIFTVLDKKEIYPFIHRVLFKKEGVIRFLKWALRNNYIRTLEKIGIFNFYLIGISISKCNVIVKISEKLEPKNNMMKFILMKWLFANENFKNYFIMKYIDYKTEGWTAELSTTQKVEILQEELEKIKEERLLSKKRWNKAFPLGGKRLAHSSREVVLP